MIPSLSARWFRTRLAFTRTVSRTLQAVDGSDVLSVLCLAAVFAGVAMFSLGLAFIVVGALIGMVTPIGAAFRIFVRGR